jgi:hypothetical protein
MIHKIEHGDVYKILPFIIDGVPKWGLCYNSIITGNKTTVTDDSELLRKVYIKWREKNRKNKINFSTRYAFNIYINSEIKILNIGWSLMDIIMKNRPTIFDLDSNTHLRIHKELANSSIGPLPNFEKSNTIEVENWSDNRDWYEFIHKNQPDFIEYIKSKNPIKMRSYLTEEFGHDYLGDIIAEEREKKLKTIID